MRPGQHPDAADIVATIREIVGEPSVGSGFFTERHERADGQLTEHRFAMATGWRWLHFQARYLEAFGQDLPCWAQGLHPAKRGDLIHLALSRRCALPWATPLSLTSEPQR